MNRRVAVTGLGIISPVGSGIKDFWEALTEGKCGIGFLDRFDTAGFDVKLAAQIKEFRPLDYMEKSEARRTDLFSQYALAAATQAMESSGLSSANIAPERLGVYLTSGIGGITTFAAECDKLRESGPSRVSPFFIPMMILNIAAGLIAIRYNAQGPCLPVVTACATSSHAIGEAYRAIKHGYADAIITGGAEASITPLAIAGFASCRALSTSADPICGSIPFDARRSGFVMGEGAAALVLEEYELAKSRGATVYAEITGYGNTCDAHHMTAPHPEAIGGTRAILEAASESGGVDASKIYYNAHGTSTQLNDKTETLALKKAFGDKAGRLHISSTKSMTGHMMGAAGAAEAIAAIMALREGIVPPTIGYKEPDPDCDLDYTPCKAARADIELALSASLGFGGHNACLAFKKA